MASPTASTLFPVVHVHSRDQMIFPSGKGQLSCDDETPQGLGQTFFDLWGVQKIFSAGRGVWNSLSAEKGVPGVPVLNHIQKSSPCVSHILKKPLPEVPVVNHIQKSSPCVNHIQIQNSLSVVDCLPLVRRNLQT